MNFTVLTLFPELIENAMNTSICKRAMEKGYISLDTIDIRDFAENKNGRVDDYTYGGGAGMLMQAGPVYSAYKEACRRLNKEKAYAIYMTPQGRVFDQRVAEELAQHEDLVIICGHYEGIDERALEEIGTDNISIGDYVLTGGELAAMVVIDSISRLVPGVLNNDVSAETESFSDGLLEYPQYTRPVEFRGKKVPEVLLSGHHAKIDEWRHEKSLERTKRFRPDLYETYLKDHPEERKN